MIMVGRSLVCGSRGGAPSTVPGPRAGGLPERRHERAGAEGARSRRPRRRCASSSRTGAAASRGSSTRLSASPSCARAWRRCSAPRPPTWLSPARPPTASTPCSTRVDIRPGDEILTSDEEHPGVLGPLATARDVRGARVRVVPFDELPDEVGPDTRFVVCSHVSWATGRVMDTEPLTASDAIVVLDGAQGLGAVPIDARELGCDFYAASGQKWLCGPGGMGYLYADPELVPSLPAPWAATTRSRTPSAGSSRRCGRTRAGSDTGFPAPHHVEWSHASLDVLEAGRLRPRPRAGRRAGGPPRRAAPRPRRERGAARRDHAGLLRGPRPARVHGAGGRRGPRDPRHSGPSARARLGRSLEHRARSSSGSPSLPPPRASR